MTVSINTEVAQEGIHQLATKFNTVCSFIVTFEIFLILTPRLCHRETILRCNVPEMNLVRKKDPLDGAYIS